MNLVYPTAEECLQAAIAQHHLHSGWKTVDNMIWTTQISTNDGLAWELGAHTHQSEQILQPLGILGSVFASRKHMQEVVSELVDINWHWERPKDILSIADNTIMIGSCNHWQLRSWNQDMTDLHLDNHPMFTTRKALIDFVYERISDTQTPVLVS